MIGPPCILVIEDESQVRLILSQWLARHGYEVREAADGQEGLDSLRERLPDVVLCDLRMPNVDGLTVLAEARKLHPSLPFIVMSGQGVLGDAITALKLGAWDYILKPFGELAVLNHAIEKALERAALRRDNERYKQGLERANRELSQSLRLLEEDEVAGRDIQRRLLPEPWRRLGELELAHDLTPSTHLSGDFVDCRILGDGGAAFYIADVSGHGVSSALVTVFLKTFMQRALADAGQAASPAHVLGELNQALLRERFGKHVVAFLGMVDGAGGELRYATAGQFPAPILVDRGEPTFLMGRGLPAGLFGFAHYEDVRLALPPRFSLLLCSDGVLELVEGERLHDKCAQLLNLAAAGEVTVKRLRKALLPSGAAGLADDVTLLVVRRGEG